MNVTNPGLKYALVTVDTEYKNAVLALRKAKAQLDFATEARSALIELAGGDKDSGIDPNGFPNPITNDVILKGSKDE